MKTKRPYGTNAKRRSVTITEPDWQKLKALGNGNASAGIREALRMSNELERTGSGEDRQYEPKNMPAL